MSPNKTDETRSTSDTLSFQQPQSKDSLARSGWPMIHCTPAGTKKSLLPGPISDDVEIEHFQGESSSIVITIDDDLVYYQQAQNTIDCFSVDDFGKPLNTVDLNATFPAVGGNVVDREGHVYFTRFGQLIRFDRGLKNPVVSENLEPADALYNGVGFMIDGNLLVTSTRFAHVVSPRARKGGKLPVLSTTDLRQSAVDGVPTFASRMFGPRPVYDDQGGVYMNGLDYLAKLTYAPQITKLQTMPQWAFRCPQAGGNLTLANPMLVGDNVWTISNPPADQPMQLYCVAQNNGALVGQCTPFPTALGQTSAHTLGAVPSANLILAICDTADRSGGMVAIDSRTLDVRWRLPLSQISQAFAISEASGVAYISAWSADERRIDFLSIRLEDGQPTILTSVASDSAPPASLPSVGPGGNLFYPTSDGCLKIRQR